MRILIFLSLIIATSFSALAQEQDSILYVAPDQLDAYWIAEKKVAPKYTKRSLRNGEQGCVAIGFFIESDGTTSGHRVVVFYPSNDFEKSSIEAAKQFLYKPSVQNLEREIVFTTNIFTYLISSGRKPDDKKQEQLANICKDAADKSLNTDTGMPVPVNSDVNVSPKNSKYR